MVTEQTDCNWGEVAAEIVLGQEFTKGLLGLADFSHVLVVYHLHEAKFVPEKHLTRHPQGRTELPKVGIFAQRAKD